MAYTENARAINAVAAGDLSSDQRKMVKFNSDGEVELAGEGEYADGILAEAVDGQGKATSIVVPDGGIAMVMASASLSRGAEFACSSGGKAKAVATGDKIMGRLLEAPGADGEIVAAQFSYRGEGA